MVIKDNDFLLEQCGNSLFWDLSLLKTIKGVRGKESREEMTLESYGITLPGALQKIAYYRIGKKQDSMSIKSFLLELNKIISDLKGFVEITLNNEILIELKSLKESKEKTDETLNKVLEILKKDERKAKKLAELN